MKTLGPGKIKRQETKTPCRQNSTHQKNIMSIQYKIGKISHQTETDRTDQSGNSVNPIHKIIEIGRTDNKYKPE
ncbi:MAG: hypothetical protein A2035_02805 [Nitrospirae bacterium GWA2_42_11]|nr:MAG: hypothetical protein A2035_02805 [Nitrospirae bacterium GWA2_42_11]